MELASLGQNLSVLLEEIAVGQPPLFLVALGPGIAEVQVDPVHLAGGKHLRQQGGVGIDKADVLQPGVPGPLHGYHHGVGHLLHGDQQHVRLCRRCTGGEATLSAA